MKNNFIIYSLLVVTVAFSFNKSMAQNRVTDGSSRKPSGSFEREATRSPISGSVSGEVTPVHSVIEIKSIHSESAKEQAMELIRGKAEITSIRTGATDSEGYTFFQEATEVQIPNDIRVVEATVKDYAQLYFESINAACLYTFESESSLQLTECSAPELVPNLDIRVQGKVGVVIHSEHLSDKTTIVGRIVLPIAVIAPVDTPLRH
jgi:hypothetical protein